MSCGERSWPPRWAFDGAFVLDRSGAAVGVAFAYERRAWSEGALSLYRGRVAAAARELLAWAGGGERLVLEDGVAIVAPADDPRPGWPAQSDEALELVAMQLSLLAHDLAEIERAASGAR